MAAAGARSPKRRRCNSAEVAAASVGETTAPTNNSGVREVEKE